MEVTMRCLRASSKLEAAHPVQGKHVRRVRGRWVWSRQTPLVNTLSDALRHLAKCDMVHEVKAQ